ncbi:MAG: dihydroorotase [Bacteroidetes bacterium]|nr:dihydroorotase [Bacteroidota bacterium]
MPDYLLSQVKLIAPAHALHRQAVDIRVLNGHIQDIQPASSLHAAPGEEVISYPGLHVSAGWVDTHCVLNDPGYEQRDTLESLAASALAGGFTDVITLPGTEPVQDNAQQVRALRSRAQSLRVRLHPMGAATLSCAGKEMAELVELSQAGAVAFSDGLNPIQDAGVFMRTLQYLALTDGLLVQMPLNAAVEGNGIANESPAVTRLGLKPSPVLAEVLMVSTCVEMLRYTGGRLHLSPISSAQSLAQIRQARAEGLRLTASTFPQYLLLTDDTLAHFDTRFKMRPPLRTQADVLALRAAVADGTLEVLATGHAPATIDEKRLEFDYATFGAPALETAFAVAWTALQGHATLDQLVDALTSAPRRLFNLPQQAMAPGEPAALTLFLPETLWAPAPGDIHSPYRLTPYEGMPLTGRVWGTLMGAHLHRNPLL